MMLISWSMFVGAIWAVTRYSCCLCVRISELNVPTVALEGDDVHLRCDYDEDEGASSLYTLKWYKDGKEFYRHQPGISPHTTDDRCADDHTYAVHGVHVDCWASTERDVVLSGVSKSTSGDYQCEVIGEHPKFRKEVRKARLTVFSESLGAPVVSGDQDSYRVLDSVSLNCSSSNSEYNPLLSWQLNGHPASSENVVKYPDRRSVGLRFVASVDLFRRGVIEVTCMTSLGASHVMSKKVQLPNRDYLSAQEYYFNSGLKRSGCDWCTMYCLLFSVAVLFYSV